MSTCPPLPSSLLLTSSSRPFCLTEDSPITGKWQTNYRGRTFHLDAEGRLRPAQRKAPMATARTTEPLDPAFTTRIPGIPDPEPTIHRIVSEELHALALRREAHRRAQEER